MISTDIIEMRKKEGWSGIWSDRAARTAPSTSRIAHREN